MTLGHILYSFFEDYLKVQKGLRPASVRAYRDAVRLFLQFTAKNRGCKISKLSFSDLTHERAVNFLKYLEGNRGNQAQTRNHRLTVMRTLFDYIASRMPEMLSEAGRVTAIPNKRAKPSETHFLSRNEIHAIFSGLSTTGRDSLRNKALLLFLYNTGARVQEVVDLRVSDLHFSVHPSVHLHGKGDKWRTCPLWAETASLLMRLLKENDLSEDSPVFTSHGKALTRFGIYKIVRRHTKQLTLGSTSRYVSPHIFRHTTAVHLLEAGVEVNVIRGWLGHVSLDTTNRYAEITIRTKEDALRTCEPPTSSEGFPRRPVWRDDENLLKWLNSL
jgi:site-specific recombinase XerD